MGKHAHLNLSNVNPHLDGGVQPQVFPASQRLEKRVELGAVAHELVDSFRLFADVVPPQRRCATG